MRNAQSSKDTHQIGANILWNSVGTLIYFGCQWLLTVLVVRLNGNYSDAGNLSLAMSVSTTLYGFATLSLRTFQVSDLDEQFTDGDFIINRLLASGISFLMCVAFVMYKNYDINAGLCIIAFMTVRISEALADVLHGLAQKAWRLDIAGKSFILRGGIGLAAFIFGKLIFGNLVMAILLMSGTSFLIVYFYDFRVCERSVKIDFKYTKRGAFELLKIGIPLAAYGIFLNMISTVPRIQIEEQCGQELLGIFSSVATITVIIPQLSSFIFNPLMGVFAEYRKNRDKRNLCKLLLFCMGIIAAIGVLAVLAGHLLSEWVLVLLFGNAIKNYVGLLVPIICTAILTAMIWLMSGLLTVFKDYHVLTGITFVSLIVCLLTSPSLIAAQQLSGAVIALSTALGLECILLGIRFVFVLTRLDREDRNDKLENSHNN